MTKQTTRVVLVALSCAFALGCATSAAEGSGQRRSAFDVTPPELAEPIVLPESIRTLRVSPSGSDSADGSTADPWRTLGHAVSQLEPGDLLQVDAGVYAGPVLMDRSGTADAWIRIVASQGATIDAATAGVGLIVSGSYVEVRGIGVRGPGEGIVIGDNHSMRNDICANLDAYIATFPEEEQEEELGWMYLECGEPGTRPATNHVTRHVILDGRIDSPASDGRDRALVTTLRDDLVGIRIEDEAEALTIRNYELAGGRSGIVADFEWMVYRIDGLVVEHVWIHGTHYYGMRITARQRWRFIEGGEGRQFLRFVEGGEPLIGSTEPIPIRSQLFTNIRVSDCLFENNAFADEPTNEGYGNVLIQGVRGGVVERSRFIDAPYWGLDALMSHDLLFRNNIFAFSPGIRERTPRFRDWPTVGLEVNGGTGNRVYNNLFVGGEAGIFTSLFSEDFVTTEVSVDIQNNLFYDNLTSISRFPLSNWLESDEVEPNWVMWYAPVGGFSVDRRESNNMMDTGVNIEIDGSQFLAGEPEFFGTGNRVIPAQQIGFLAPEVFDFTLLPDSPAVDAGAALDSVPDDFRGRPRPQGEGFDLGPYEMY